MNLAQNRIPENVKTIHLIAICGTGMAALACMLKDWGTRSPVPTRMCTRP